jgi:decaprenylphospho-beta-D-ribofuranose 2-oxidase
MKEYNVVSFLGVLKKFGKQDGSLIGFPSPGWTLAVDIPASRTDFIDELKNQISALIEIQGKIYLTKDSILNQTQFKDMYPKYDQWIAAKKGLDPMGFWQSDQGIRLGLC